MVAISCLHVVIAVRGSRGFVEKWLSDLISLRRDMDGMVVLAVSSQSLGRSFGVADLSAA